MIKPTTIEQLILLRRRRDWNQEVTAKKLGVSKRTLASWEDGSRKPKPIVMQVIRRFIEEHSK